MRQVVLNGTDYEITGDTIHRAISPWKAKVVSRGLEYSDFSQAELEEWHDFRNGIGLESALPDESARLWWSEGVDFSTARSAVLGPKVNTAGTFGVAPVKIIDFESQTYAIGNNKISESHAATPSWTLQGALIEDCNDVWESTASPTYVTITADTTVKKVGTASVKIDVIQSIASEDNIIGYEDFTAVSLADYTKINFWFRSAQTLTAGDLELILDDHAGCLSPTETIAFPAITSANTWIPIQLTIATPANCTAIQSVGINNAVAIDDTNAFYIDHIVADGCVTAPIDAIVVTDSTDTYLVVSSADIAMYYDGTTWTYLNGCQGYLAFYDTKLRSISTTGGTVYSSAANDVDGTWTNFSLTGHFGTVYDLFEGKLLADGTPIIYFCGTEGLFTIDITNEKAYKQEVEYPPLTYAGHVGKYWNANVWVSTGYGILKVAPSMATFIGPDQDDGLPSTYQGSIFDMTTVNNWLVFCVNKTAATDKSSILKRNSSLGGNLQVYTSAADTAIACLHHSPSSMYTNGRLWFGEGTSVKYMMFPDTTSNVKQIATYEYVDDSGYGKLPIFRKLAAIPKVALGLAAITKSCDGSDYVAAYYGLNGAAPTTSLGNFQSSPRATILTFPSTGGGLGEAFYTIQFAIKLIQGATDTNSPELESLLFYYYATPTRISAWTFNVVAIGAEADEIFTAFETILDTVTLVAFYPSGDTKKTAYNVKLTNLPSREFWEEQGGREGFFQVTVQEVFKG